MQLSTMQNHWPFGHKSAYFLPSLLQNSKKQKAGQNKLESPTSKSPVKRVMKGTNLKPFVVTINPTPHFYKPITEKNKHAFCPFSRNWISEQPKSLADNQKAMLHREVQIYTRNWKDKRRKGENCPLTTPQGGIRQSTGVKALAEGLAGCHTIPNKVSPVAWVVGGGRM